MDEPRRRRAFLEQMLLRRAAPLRKRSPLRSFALGGLVGAAGAIAAVRRLSSRPRTLTGLAAFEDAPCFVEVVEREGRGYADPAGERTGAE